MGLRLHQKIFIELHERIVSGRYPVGSLLPTEQELCAEFDVSRYTVREALRQLSDAGFLTRRQGSGSEVLSDKPHNKYVQTMRSLHELYDYASETTLDIGAIDTITADVALSERLGRTSGRRWLHVTAVRRQPSGEPICFVEVHIHGDYRDIAGEIADLSGPIYDHIEESYDVAIVEVIQTISAEPLPAAAAQALGLAAGDIAIKVIRRYLAAGDKPIQVSTNWHPAQSYSYTMSIRREDLPG